MFDFSNKVIFVAGGAGYLCMPLCRLIAQHGGKVCIGDYNADLLAQAVDTLKGEFPDADILGLSFDIGDADQIKKCLAACVGHFGGLDGVVNATFGGTAKTLDELTGEDFDRANHLNLTGPFLLAREAASYMTNGGSIVMYASMYGVVAPNPQIYPDGMNPNPIEYGVGKAGLIQMVRYLAAHYGPGNIRVNGVAPGPFPNAGKADIPDDFNANLSRSTMLGRVGEQHETAGPTFFLLSDAASYVTGHVLNIDGGWTAW